jgi:hypothetical protein
METLLLAVLVIVLVIMTMPVLLGSFPPGDCPGLPYTILRHYFPPEEIKSMCDHLW